jgi:hypothetical protein
MSLEHANRNTELCDKLLTEGVYLDWVITTAFYAAMHYIDSKIYPTNYNGNEYKDFYSYYESECKKSNINKHSAKKKLFTNHNSDLGEKYKYLYDACQSARYEKYNVSSGAAIHARKKLDLIKKLI